MDRSQSRNQRLRDKVFRSLILTYAREVALTNDKCSSVPDAFGVNSIIPMRRMSDQALLER